MNTNRSKTTVNRSHQLSKEFGYDPAREAELLKLTKKPIDTKVYDFDEMKRYSQINRPFVGQQKRKMIQEKLQLDKTAQVHAIARIKQDNFFIAYERNPFVETEDQIYRMHTKNDGFLDNDYNYYHQKLRKGVTKDKDIVEAINKISQKDIQRQFNPLAQRWDDIRRLTQNNIKNLNKNTTQKRTFQDEEAEEQQVRQSTFDDIIDIQEESYYAKNQIDINVFQVLKGNHKTFLTNSILDRYYFCHNSMMDKITTFRFPILRDLSKLGRKFTKDHRYKQPMRLDNITSNEMSFKIGEIKFIDLLSIASGRFTPQMVYKASNEIEVREDSNSIKSQIQQLEVNYREHHKNKTILFETDQTDQMEILDYLKLQNTREEQRYAQKCNKMMKYVQNQMQKKANLTGNTIHDKQLHRQIDNNVNDYIQYMANMDFRKEQTQKIIRKNKLSKDRNQAIKIRTLLNSIVLKNREQQKMKILLDNSK